MRNFASGLTYTINDSTPIIYGNACSPNAFMSHIGARGLHGAFDGGVGGAHLVVCLEDQRRRFQVTS